MLPPEQGTVCSPPLTGQPCLSFPGGLLVPLCTQTLGAAQAGEHGTDTGGMEGTGFKRPGGFIFYLLCYSVLSPGEEIRLPPQEAEEGVDELGTGREREQ